jgi:hypothetical protein
LIDFLGLYQIGTKARYLTKLILLLMVVPFGLMLVMIQQHLNMLENGDDSDI